MEPLLFSSVHTLAHPFFFSSFFAFLIVALLAPRLLFQIKSIQLMTNNPFKLEWLRATGVKVEGRIPVQVAANEHNHGYLEAKAARMSHLINTL